MWLKSRKKLDKGDHSNERKQPDVGLSSSHEFIQFLGAGGSGDTYLMRDLATDDLVAVKLIQRPIPKAIIPEHVFREIKIQAQLGEGHVNLICAKEAILTEKHLALVLEYAAGGNMSSFVSSQWNKAAHTGFFLSEDEARYYFRQFLNAVEYCHKHKVAHRDLKLDNTLLTDSSPPRLKLCDFGFAKGWLKDTDQNMFTHIGTPVYMAPEVIDSRNGMRGYDGLKADAWACGVLLVAMLLGTFPFDHKQHPDPNSNEAQLEVWLQQVHRPWTASAEVRNTSKRISPECKDLLDRIFVVDQNARISVEDMKKHPWYNKPLSGRYQAAENRMLSEQAEIDKDHALHQIDEELLKARDKQLLDMVRQAMVRAEKSWTHKKKPLLRIDLRDKSVEKWGTARIPSTGRIEVEEGVSNNVQSQKPDQLSTGVPASNGSISRDQNTAINPKLQGDPARDKLGPKLSFAADEESFRKLTLN